jgi:mono/diheme cytochrome c family protein
MCTAAVGLAAAVALGCARQKQQTAMEYMPDMAYGPRVAAQREDPLRPGQPVMRNIVPGTVPAEYTPYRYAAGDSLQAQQDLQNPLPRTMETLARGRTVYMNTCVVCHGPEGDGKGYIVPPFPTPPTLHSDRVRQWPDGRIFHVITRGQNLMPSYASQILPEDRWAVIHYLRALERSHRPLPGDLPAGGAAAGAGAGAAAGRVAGGATP